MDTESLGRKERERLFRRDEIMNSAVKLFAKKGFNSTTLEEIAEAAEFGKGTLYNYFSSKEEIYFTIFNREIEAFLSIIDDADKLTTSLREFLEHYITCVFKRCIENPDAFILMVQEIINRDLRGYIKIKDEFMKFKQIGQEVLLRRFKEAISSGEIRDDIPPLRLSNFLRHLMFPYLHEIIYHENPQSLDIDKEVSMVFTVFFNGILINK